MNHQLLLLCLSILVALAAPAEEPKTEPALLPAIAVTPIKFVDGTLIGEVGREEIERMGQRELKLDGGHSYEFVTKGKTVVETRTLAAYRNAILGGGELVGGYATACADRFIAGWSTWEFLQQTKPARVSHFDQNWMGTLSVDLVGWVGSDEKQQREDDVKAGKTLADYQKSGKILRLMIGKKSTTFNGYRSCRIKWLASGDVDGDGVEDRLILVHLWAPEGSASIKGTYLVSRPSAATSCSNVKPFLEQNSSAR